MKALLLLALWITQGSRGSEAGFTPLFKESPGGHTWANWRDYLREFAPQLFQPQLMQ